MSRGKVVAGGIVVLGLFMALAALAPHPFGVDDETATFIAYAIGTTGAIGLLIYALKARFTS